MKYIVKEKPKLKTMTYLDYNDCAYWIQQEYDVIIRNGGRDGEDYWLWLLDHTWGIRNGSFFTLSVGKWIEDEDGDVPEWVKKISRLFLEEFGEHANEDGDIEFWVSW